MRIAMGSDDRSLLTQSVLEDLQRRGFEVETYRALREGCDPNWPDVAFSVSRVVASGRCQQGILFCYTGTGVSIAANKVPGVRAALCSDAETARGARLWNDANVLCLSLRLTSPQVAREILDAWFSTEGIDPTEKPNIDKIKKADALHAGTALAGSAPHPSQEY
ncbi:MAG: RpiB/LacA/LacB family sugar-phosphate isomerase [SAR202 cluster bacterium]|nr:RpiB/LacA/LacB family sugar-phosphate isomerase [SAR202 cluster bacterium]